MDRQIFICISLDGVAKSRPTSLEFHTLSPPPPPPTPPPPPPPRGMGHDCCSKKKGGCSKSSSAPAASSEASRYEAAPGPSREPAEASVCDVCSFPGPCPDQGLCMDPTVIQSDADSSLIYVIEGQAYSRNDSRWETKALPSQVLKQ